MTDDESTEYAQRAVTAFFRDLALEGPPDISDFVDKVLSNEEPATFEEVRKVDRKAIAIIQQVAQDLLK